MKSKTYLASCIGIYLVVAGLVVANVFLYQIHQRATKQSEPVRWQYNEFKTRSAWYFTDTNYLGQIIDYDTALSFLKYQSNPTNEIIEMEPERVSSASGILERLGSDGWEIAWANGNTYIVRRKSFKTKWSYESFQIWDMPVRTNKAKAWISH